jgi:hypothetical protein
LLTTGSLLLAVVPVARAATFDSQPVPGFQDGISCVTSRLCVIVGYNNQGIGDVVRVRDGVPGPGTAIPGSKALYSVSCAEGAGCTALGVTSNGASPVVVTLSSGASVVSSKVVSVAPGVSLTRIACVTPGNCVLSGLDLFASPEALAVAHWDGSALSVHKIAGPAGASDPTLEGLSCSGAACVAVGSAFKGANSNGIILSIANGKPTQLRVAAGDSIYGASCVSTTLCYGAGFNRSGGVVLTIGHGAPGAITAVPADDLLGIACRSQDCWAVGERLAPPGAPAKDAYYGTLVPVSSGHPGQAQLVPASGGFTNVAQYGGSFAALGAAQGKASEVTTFG